MGKETVVREKVSVCLWVCARTLLVSLHSERRAFFCRLRMILIGGVDIQERRFLEVLGSRANPKFHPSRAYPHRIGLWNLEDIPARKAILPARDIQHCIF